MPGGASPAPTGSVLIVGGPENKAGINTEVAKLGTQRPQRRMATTWREEWREEKREGTREDKRGEKLRLIAK